MIALIFRCQNGTVGWARTSTGQGRFNWTCARDGFTVPGATTPANLEATVISLAGHSSTLAGAILQVIELDL